MEQAQARKERFKAKYAEKEAAIEERKRKKPEQEEKKLNEDLAL